MHRREQLAVADSEHPPPLLVRRRPVHRLLTFDAIQSYWFADGFGVDVGSLVLTADASLLAGYTFGCHSLRHLVRRTPPAPARAGPPKTPAWPALLVRTQSTKPPTNRYRYLKSALILACGGSGNSLSDLLLLGKLAGEHAAKYAMDHPAAGTPSDQIEDAAKCALAPFDRAASEGPFQTLFDLQDMMQDLVGIVRKEDEMVRALDGSEKLKARAATCKVEGRREYNPGWHTAIDLHNLLTVSEGITRGAILCKESRGAQFRDDCPTKDTKNFGKANTIVRRAVSGRVQMTESSSDGTRMTRIPARMKRIKSRVLIRY